MSDSPGSCLISPWIGESNAAINIAWSKPAENSIRARRKEFEQRQTRFSTEIYSSDAGGGRASQPTFGDKIGRVPGLRGSDRFTGPWFPGAPRAIRSHSN